MHAHHKHKALNRFALILLLAIIVTWLLNVLS